MMAYFMLGFIVVSVCMLKFVELRECGKKSLGLRDDAGLPYYFFQGTSYSPECMNKNINKNATSGATWCPEKGKEDKSFLEVDLGKQYTLCGVSTQGDSNGFTKSYKIELSPERIHWEFYYKNSDKVFKGNNDSTTEVYNELNATRKTRFVRFYPVSYNTSACIRVELYGQEIVKERCEKNVINDVNAPGIVVSSLPNIPLNKHAAILNGTEPWCWSSSDTEPYLRINFGAYIVICALQVNFSGVVEISNNESTNAQEINGSKFYGQDKKILTTFLQLKPVSYFKNTTCISVKTFGYLTEDLLNNDIGFQYGASSNVFPDESLATSSNQFDKVLHNPRDGRLYKPWEWWSPKNRYLPFYLELILVQQYYLFAVSVQGQSTSNYMKDFRVSFSDNYRNWKDYNTKFIVNFDDKIMKHSFVKPFKARIVRIHLHTSPKKSSLRVELHGIVVEESQGHCKKAYPLGLSSHAEVIPDDSITASSKLEGLNFEPWFARLRKGDDKCWCGKTLPNQAVRVDFGKLVSVFGVATQGCKLILGKVVEYKIRYSYDNSSWYGYPSNSSLQIFSGNSGPEDEIFANWLNNSITARHILLESHDYKNFPCFRLEFYGCRSDVVMPAIIKRSDSKSLNRSSAARITLDCQIRGQAGLIVTWKRDGKTIKGSDFESVKINYSQELVISTVTTTEININYRNDRDIFYNFNCTGSKNNSRRLLCRTVYSCSASYPGSSTASQGNVLVTITPDIVLPDSPGNPSVINIKSRSAVVTWRAADDYLESRLKRYVIRVVNDNQTMQYNITSEIQRKNFTYKLQNLTEYTFYNVSIAAESEIAISKFTEISFLTLFGPHIYLDGPSLRIVKLNVKNNTIPCRGKSYPTPRVVWKKNGTLIPSGENITTVAGDSVYQIITNSGWDEKTKAYLEVTSTLFLRTNGVKEEVHGIYTCEVLNVDESSIPLSKRVEIQFPPHITRHLNDTKMNESGNITFVCDAEGPPKPSFFWNIVRKNIKFGKKIINENVLELRNVTSTGNYYFTVICRASSKAGNVSTNATVQILVKPRIIHLNSSLTAELYSDIVLKCEILANPSAQIWWTVNGNKAHLRNNVQISNDNKTFIITRAVLNNAGEYYCHARNSLSYTNKSLTLDFKVLPIAYIIDGNLVKLRQGQKNRSITCLGYGYPNTKATWKFNNTVIPEDSKLSKRNGMYQQRSANNQALENVSSILYFNQSGSTFDDSGNYTCEVSIGQESKNDSKIVRVIFYPIILTPPRNKTSLQDRNVRFDCEVDGRPFPQTSWLFKNQTVSTNHSTLSNGSLLLYSVQNNAEYEGSYSCLAKNEAGSSKKSNAFLTVHVATRILSISETEVYQLNDSVILTCNVSGDPRPNIAWSKGTNPLGPPRFLLSNDDQSLTIVNVTLREQGTYFCEARNKYATVQRNVTVNVEVRPEAIVNVSSVINFTSIKEQVIVRCEGRGYPTPVVRWFRDGGMVTTNRSVTPGVYQRIGNTEPSKFLGWISAILYVKPDASHAQFGNYTCNVTKLKDSQKDLKNVEIVLVPSVFITKSPNTSTVLQGTNVTFNCTAIGVPKPTVTWNTAVRRNTTLVPSVLGTSVLALKNVTNKDEGMYECSAHNRGSPVKRKIKLIVHVRPQILQDLKDNDIENGTSYVLNCSAYGDPKLTYSWLFNGKKSIPNAAKNNTKSSLYINPVTVDNEGIYTCMVSNIEGNKTTTANITVFARPKISNSPVNQTHNETERAIFSCGGSGIPTPRVIWRRNNRSISNSSRKLMNNVHGPYNTIKSWLRISSLSYADRGEYSCELKNRKDGDRTTSVLVVHVRPIATIAVTPNTKRVKIEKPVLFTCTIYGFPRPQVSWMKNKEELTRNNSRYSISFPQRNISNLISWFSYLEIKNLTRNDSANYSCFLRNDAGTDIDHVSLVVLERPDPVDLTAKNITARSALLQWKANFQGNSDIKFYNLTYFVVGRKSVTMLKKSFPSNVMSYVTSVKPYRNYTFEITAENDIGVSDVASTSAQTKEDTPSKPLNLIAYVTSNTTVHLSWEPPSNSNGIILEYLVYYKKTKEKNGNISNSTVETEYRIDKLTPYTNYSFWVYAVTSVGRGDKSVTIWNMTFEGVPTEPQSVTAEPLNSTSISVNWTKPANTFGIILKYVVYYRKTTDKNGWEKGSVSGNEYFVRLTSLEVNTEYHILVQAFTSAGGGARSEIINSTTEKGHPVSPTKVPGTFKPSESSFDSKTMVALELPKFADKNGEISFYIVIVAMLDDTKEDTNDIFDKNIQFSSEQWNKRETGIPYVVFAFKGNVFEEYKYFIVGNGEKYDDPFPEESEPRRKRAITEYENGPLISSRKYAVALRGYTTKDKYATTDALVVSTSPADSGSRTDEDSNPLIWIVPLVIISILGAIFVALWFQRKCKKRDNTSLDSPYHRHPPTGIISPIPLAEFRFYLRSKEFGDNEFRSIPATVSRETSDATSDVNMSKNRYRNIVPYNYTRVHLQREERDQNTDYINASFIKGYRVPSKYIATQGPLPATCDDFWQMVWEQDVNIIVMLTGLEEKGIVKCYQYWPANSDEKRYGKLQLKLTGETKLADFTTRYFEIKEIETGQVRLVQHLHFTAWPDHGVPKYPGPLLHFHKRYRSGLAGQSGPEPVVVHCSAGVGRTGTFIAVDYILHKLDEEKDDDPSIDIPNVVREMRKQRVYMVQTEAQYRFIHHAILEAISFPDTEKSSTDIRERAASLRENIPGTIKTKGKELFENLQKRVEQESCEDGFSSDNQKKNRSQLLPFDYNRVHLEEVQNRTDYINASFICGYQFAENFIATQHPMSNTVNDFWRMIHEQKSAVVVAISTREELNALGPYWPEDGYTSYGPITVAFEEINRDFAASGFTIRNFKLSDTRDNVGCSLSVTHFHFDGWSQRVLPSTSSMLCLLAEVEKAQRSSGNRLVTVHCDNGGGRTGTFCALVSCIERVKVENNIDLQMTLRNLQAQRKEMIANEAQYIFCYDVVSAFLTSFDEQMYANFKGKDAKAEDEHDGDGGGDYSKTTKDDKNRLVTNF
ncbi:uncharacterized protein LOC114532921 [Dendronephthya gigantea]|uniref:uncharacterized protein LOC114532921 n=1 Tax=Dendronephthya gigantea TaxID=151771 RepID=UPI00106C2B15|nr:uncharacterized protein LOC114532921 [Dendronephthya gigantea]